MTDPSDDFAGDCADIPGFPADGRHILAVIGADDGLGDWFGQEDQEG